MTISIIGCGWLGLPLAEHLIKQGHRTKGSTTRASKLSSLEAAGIKAYQISLQPNWTLLKGETDFLQSDVIVVNVPPGRKKPDVVQFHTQQMEALVQQALQAGGNQRILLASSTGVYAPLNRKVNEHDAHLGTPTRASGKALRLVEQLWQKNYPNHCTIVRLAGLAGPNRHPGRFFAGKQQVTGGNTPVNFVHLHDAIGVIAAIIQQQKWGKVYNVCAIEHPTKKRFYTEAAAALMLAAPKFSDNTKNTSPYKEIDSSFLRRDLNYTFKYDNPLDFL